jgi:hypothetical protein
MVTRRALKFVLLAIPRELSENSAVVLIIPVGDFPAFSGATESDARQGAIRTRLTRFFGLCAACDRDHLLGGARAVGIEAVPADRAEGAQGLRAQGDYISAGDGLLSEPAF